MDIPTVINIVGTLALVAIAVIFGFIAFYVYKLYTLTITAKKVSQEFVSKFSSSSDETAGKISKLAEGATSASIAYAIIKFVLKFFQGKNK